MASQRSGPAVRGIQSESGFLAARILPGRHVLCGEPLGIALPGGRRPASPWVLRQSHREAEFWRAASLETLNRLRDSTDVIGPLCGICWYPVLDIPDWGELRPGLTLEHRRVSHSGLIHVRRGRHGRLRRHLERGI